jgi:hypothetical protein
MKSLGDRTSDSGLAGASHAVQPKDTFVARVVPPRHQLPQEIDSGIGEALRLVLTRAGVKGGISSIRKLG